MILNPAGFLIYSDSYIAACRVGLVSTVTLPVSAETPQKIRRWGGAFGPAPDQASSPELCSSLSNHSRRNEGVNHSERHFTQAKLLGSGLSRHCKSPVRLSRLVPNH